MTDPNARGFAHTREQFQQLVEDALALARTLGASEAGVEVSEGVGLSVSVRKGEVENVERNRDKSLGITVYVGKRRGNASTSDFSRAALEQTVRAAHDIARFTAEDPAAGLPEVEDLAFGAAAEWLGSTGDTFVRFVGVLVLAASCVEQLWRDASPDVFDRITAVLRPDAGGAGWEKEIAAWRATAARGAVLRPCACRSARIGAAHWASRKARWEDGAAQRAAEALKALLAGHVPARMRELVDVVIPFRDGAGTDHVLLVRVQPAMQPSARAILGLAARCADGDEEAMVEWDAVGDAAERAGARNVATAMNDAAEAVRE
jgi:hypothetical protein